MLPLLFMKDGIRELHLPIYAEWTPMFGTIRLFSGLTNVKDVFAKPFKMNWPITKEGTRKIPIQFPNKPLTLFNPISIAFVDFEHG